MPSRAPDPGCPDVGRRARRILARAIKLLEQWPLSDRSVHAVRKNLKIVRALLRMIRGTVDAAAYHRADRALREVMRTLSAVRDSRVLLETLDSLPERDRPAAATSGVEVLRCTFKRAHARMRRRLLDERGAVKCARKSLRALRRRMFRKQSVHFDWPVLEAGMRRVYARARTTLGRIRDRPNAPQLHKLRKQTQYLWHQLDAIDDACPSSVRRLTERTHQLADLLGDDHNLAVLRDQVAHASLDPVTRDTLFTQVDLKRERLVTRAQRLARVVYREMPTAFGARIRPVNARR